MVTTASAVRVRRVTLEDHNNLLSLINFGRYTHRHLDWRSPLDWIGHQPYLLLEQASRAVAALACPPDPPQVNWIRVFSVSVGISYERAWSELWGAAREELPHEDGWPAVCAMPLQGWFQGLLAAEGFVEANRVVVLSWIGPELPPMREVSGARLRPMAAQDLPGVARLDQAAFDRIWLSSQDSLERAFSQAAVATVAESEAGLLGYQISTATSMGGHLARLAVSPNFQGRGVGYTLVRDLQSRFLQRGARSITVNTQQDNLASLRLYRRAGFQPIGEEYPVYQFRQPG